MASNTGNEIDKKKDFADTSTVTGDVNNSELEDKNVLKTVQMTEKVVKYDYKHRVSRHNGLNSPLKRIINHDKNIDPGTLMVKCMELSLLQAAENVAEEIEREQRPELIGKYIYTKKS